MPEAVLQTQFQRTKLQTEMICVLAEVEKNIKIAAAKMLNKKTNFGSFFIYFNK